MIKKIKQLPLCLIFIMITGLNLLQAQNYEKSIGDSIKSIVTFYYNSPVCAKAGLLKVKVPETFRSGGTFKSTLGLIINEFTGAINLDSSLAGSYTITYAIPANADTSYGFHQSYITIRASPTLVINPNSSVAPGSSIKLLVNGGQTYTWSPANTLSCENCPDPIASPTENTTYCVSSNLGTCSSSRCTEVELVCPGNKDLQVPNAFSPDGDGNNESFCLQGWDNCVSDFSFLIFNRWGEKVFSSNDTRFCWDGTYKGRALDAGVFVYVINATYSPTSIINKKGNITLLR